MATLEAAEDFSGGANNAQISAATTGFSNVTGTTANAIHTTAWTLPGATRSMKCSSSAYVIGVVPTASHTRHRRRISVHIGTLPPSGTTRVLYEVMVGSGATIAWQLRLQAAGTLQIRNVSTSTDISSTVFAAGDDLDLDIDLDGAGNATVGIFTGDNSATSIGQFRLAATAAANETLGGDATAGALTATNFSESHVGHCATTTGGNETYFGYLSNLTNSEVPTPYVDPTPAPEAGDLGNMKLSKLVAGVETEMEFLKRTSGTGVLYALDRKAPTTPPGGAISSILVPTSGAWFGAETPDQDGVGATLTGLEWYENTVGRTPDILHFYKTVGWNGAISTSERNMQVRPGKPMPLLMYNWKIRTNSQDWNDIAAGTYDNDIDAACVGFRARTRKWFLTIWHEPEDNVGSGASASDFVAAFEHVVARMRSQGVAAAADGGKCVIVLNHMGYRGWESLFPTMIPNTQYFDWFGWDPYAIDPGRYTVTKWVNDSEAPTWDGMYAEAMAHGTLSTKPFMFPEWGVNHGTSGFSQSEESAFYSAMPATLEASFPNVKALIHWHGQTTSANGRNYQTYGRTTAQAGLKACAQSTYFNTARLDQIPA